jgi:hypothetical protein
MHDIKRWVKLIFVAHLYIAAGIGLGKGFAEIMIGLSESGYSWLVNVYVLTMLAFATLGLWTWASNRYHTRIWDWVRR